MNYLKCSICGWIHFGKTLREVQVEMDRFNNWFFTQPKRAQGSYGGPSTLEQYLNCFRCGEGYERMRSVDSTEVPTGSTIQPILMREEE